MTKGERLSILTEAVKQRLEKRNLSLNCRRCGKPIGIGDYFIRKRCSGRMIVSGGKASSTKYYHEKCWRGMFV